jgi:NitT/TauT family transport system permease protein
MLARRIYQFLIVYAVGLSLLLGLKYLVGLSDYVIPGPPLLWQTFRDVHGRYAADTLNTLTVAVLGQVISICLATAIGIIGRQTTWFSNFIKVAAYNVQAYPIVALAPIIFIRRRTAMPVLPNCAAG